jgi:hypothetical protein
MVFGDTSAGLGVPDLIVLDGTDLLVLSDLDLTQTEPACVRCTLSHPEGVSRGLDVAMANLDDVEGEEILVSVELGSGAATLLAYAPDCTQLYQEATIPAGREVDFGARLAVGDADDMPGSEIALTAPTSHSVYVLENASLPLPATLAPVRILEPAGSGRFPGQVVFGDFDGDPGDEEELAVADPDASPPSLGASGQVTIYKLRIDPLGMERTYEPIATLYDANAGADQAFGRSLGLAEFFASGGATSDLLVVGAKDEVFTYFRTVANAPDPRER